VFVRKVRTASGAVAVQVMRKAGGRDELVEHVGSAHTDAELGVLLERARRIAAGGQQVLDFEVPTPVERVDDVADWRAGELVRPDRPPAGVSGAGRTVGTSSRLLYDVLASVYDRLGFNVVGDAVFRDLVIARIVEPTSKADSMRVLTDLGADVVSYRTIQRHLAQMGPGGYRDLIATRCFAHAGDTGGLSLILYDVTTLYFEAEKEDELRRVGFSKERRVDPQIVVDCWSIASDSLWRSAVSTAPRLRLTRYCRSSRRSAPATISSSPRWSSPPTRACSRPTISKSWMGRGCRSSSAPA
jgi:hypothetical protein